MQGSSAPLHYIPLLWHIHGLPKLTCTPLPANVNLNRTSRPCDLRYFSLNSLVNRTYASLVTAKEAIVRTRGSLAAAMVATTCGCPENPALLLWSFPPPGPEEVGPPNAWFMASAGLQRWNMQPAITDRGRVILQTMGTPCQEH